MHALLSVFGLNEREKCFLQILFPSDIDYESNALLNHLVRRRMFKRVIACSTQPNEMLADADADANANADAEINIMAQSNGCAIMHIN